MRKRNKSSLLKSFVQTLPLMVVVVLVVYAGQLLSDIEIPTVLPVNNIKVDGELQFLDKDEIQSLVKGSISGGYFTVDLMRIRQLLLQKPWVKNVYLRRKWPASLNVFIVEQVPVAYWNDNAYLSENGDVFKPEYIDRTLNLPGLNGPQGQHANVWKFMNVLYKETALLNYEVVRLVLDERRAWQLVIAGNGAAQAKSQPAGQTARINVRLGRFDTEKRMQRFVRVLPALAATYGLTKNGFSESKIKTIDMRYPNGFAVQMTEDETTVSNVINGYAVGVNENKKNKSENLSHEFVSWHKVAVKQMSEA